MRSVALLLVLAMAFPTVALALSVPVSPSAPLVTIKRDAYGVPHIYADDAYALYWGNGYAMAQDRLFQMDVLRHVGKGESASIVGPAQLPMDLATRRELYTDEERTQRWNALPADERNMFQGFADGVNAWIRETRADPMKLSAEFYAVAHVPEDWVGEDTIAIAEFLLDIFGAGSGGNEAENAAAYFRLAGSLGDDEAAWHAFRDFWWLHDASTYTTIDPSEGTYAATEDVLDFEDVPAWQWEVARATATATPFAGGKSLVEAAQEVGFPTKFGSNAIVISPELSESGEAMLFGGPQMAYYNPMIPYEVALHGAGFDALGMGVGGAPGVIIGRTEHYAWTVTSGSSDQVDVVAFKLVEGNPRAYYLAGTSGETRDMDCRTEVHYGVPGATDQSPPVLAFQEVCRTVRGPVFAMNEEMGYAFVRERTHRLDELRSGILWLTLSQSPDLAAFQAHMESFRFEFNFFVATDDGHIAYYHFGANPDRSAACDPRLPRLAGACDWAPDVATGSDLPHVVDPAKGYIVNWNNKPAQGWSSGDSMEKWGPLHRAELIESALASRFALDGKVSIDDLKDVNVEISTRSPFPGSLVPALLAATASDPDPLVQDARAQLDLWALNGYEWTANSTTSEPATPCPVARELDACFGVHSPGFTIFEAWRAEMQADMYVDELGGSVRQMEFVPERSGDPHAADFGREDNKENTLYNAITGATAHAWCDNVNTDDAETCDEVVAAALDAAIAKLTAEYGADAADWRAPMKTIKFVGLSGGPAWRIAMVNRPSFNHYYDFGTGEAGSVLPPGTDQSWDPLPFLRYQADGTLSDAHKDDQLNLYASFGWKPAQMTPMGVESEETHEARAPVV